MRSLFISALFLFSSVGAIAQGPQGVASGFDLSNYGVRIEPLIVYDYQPGVIVRSYWWAPWQNRHYFPKTGKRPKVGRLEHMASRKSAPAEDYYRFWSVSSVFAPELPPPPVRPYAIDPVPSLAHPK